MDIKAYIESGVIESYVLGMADAQEAAELLQLSAQYPEIKQAVSAFEASLEKSALANAIAPPAFVKEKIFSALQEEFAAKKTTATVIDMPSASTNWLRYIAVASVILLIGSSVLNVYYFNKFNEVNNKYASLLNDKNSLEASINIYKTKTLDIYNSMQLMSDPMMIKVSMPGVKGKEENLATVFWDKKTKDVYLLANKLPQTTEDKQYQLWAIVDGKPVDAGLLNDCNGLCRLKNIPNAQMFAITLEKKGGSASPTMEQMFVAGAVSTS